MSRVFIISMQVTLLFLFNTIICANTQGVSSVCQNTDAPVVRMCYNNTVRASKIFLDTGDIPPFSYYSGCLCTVTAPQGGFYNMTLQHRPADPLCFIQFEFADAVFGPGQLVFCGTTSLPDYARNLTTQSLDGKFRFITAFDDATDTDFCFELEMTGSRGEITVSCTGTEPAPTMSPIEMQPSTVTQGVIMSTGDDSTSLNWGAPSVCQNTDAPVVRMCYDNTVTASKIFLDTGDIPPFSYYSGCLCTVTAPRGGFYNMTLQHRPADPLCFIQFEFVDAVFGPGQLVFCGTASLPDYTRNLTTQSLDGRFQFIPAFEDATDTDFCFELELIGSSGEITVSCTGPALKTTVPTTPVTSASTAKTTSSTTTSTTFAAITPTTSASTNPTTPVSTTPTTSASTAKTTSASRAKTTSVSIKPTTSATTTSAILITTTQTTSATVASTSASITPTTPAKTTSKTNGGVSSVCQNTDAQVVRMCYNNTVRASKIFLDTGDIPPFSYYSGCLCTVTAPQGGFYNMTLQHRPADPLCFIQFEFADAVFGPGQLVFCGTTSLPDYARNLTTQSLDGTFRFIPAFDDATDTDFCFELELTGSRGEITVSCTGTEPAPTMSPIEMQPSTVTQGVIMSTGDDSTSLNWGAPSVCQNTDAPVVRMCYNNTVTASKIFLDTGDIPPFSYYSGCMCTVTAPRGGFYNMTLQHRPADPLCFIQFEFVDAVFGPGQLVFCGTASLPDYTRNLTTQSLDGRFQFIPAFEDATDTDFCFELELIGSSGEITVSCTGPALKTTVPTTPATSASTAKTTSSTTTPTTFAAITPTTSASTTPTTPVPTTPTTSAPIPPTTSASTTATTPVLTTPTTSASTAKTTSASRVKTTPVSITSTTSATTTSAILITTTPTTPATTTSKTNGGTPSVCRNTDGPVARMCYENTATGSKLFLDSGGIFPFADLSNGCVCAISAPQGGFFNMTLQYRPADPLCFAKFQFADAVSGLGEYVFCGTAPLPDYGRNLTTQNLEGIARLVTSSGNEPTDTDFCFQLELTDSRGEITVSCTRSPVIIVARAGSLYSSFYLIVIIAIYSLEKHG